MNGPAGSATSTSSFGVFGRSVSGLVAIQGVGESGVGVEGISNRGSPGVQGSSPAAGGTDIWGFGDAFGNHGESPTGTGVDGFSAGGTGVAARSPGGVALRVEGKIQATTAASTGTVPAFTSFVTVAHAGATPASHVLVTLRAFPGTATLSHVVVGAGSFDVHLVTAASAGGVSFSYLVVD